jgi:diguanylate cyclase (GGDEF)-like protein
MPQRYNDASNLRNRIIGLGERSIKKNYYPTLRYQADELERFRAILDRTKELIILIEKEKIIDINQRALDVLDLNWENAINMSPAKIFPEAINCLFENLSSTGIVVTENALGDCFYELVIQLVVFQNREYIVIFGTDITAQKQAQEEIYKLGNYDPLTNLPNRAFLEKRLQHLYQFCSKESCNTGCKNFTNCRYSVLMLIDIDNFKALNDTQGHFHGDELLKAIAKRLNSQLNRGDLLARLGGDEFIILMEALHVSLEETMKTIESFAFNLKATLSQPYFIHGGEYTYSASIGIDIFRKIHAKEAIKHAEIAMYEAKNAGRNTIQFYDPKMQAAIRDKIMLEHSIYEALKREEFELFYQPQFNSSKQVIALEALIRWNHPKKGLVSPAIFIPLAEENGQIIPIGEWVLESVCKQLSNWKNDAVFGKLSISVNISMRQFNDVHFVEKIEHILASTQAPSKKLTLEITETLFMQNLDSAILKMQALQNLGVQFAMDDFGTGYSSLSSLKKLPLDELKIDQSFVQDIDNDSSGKVIVKTILGMAKNLNLRVVAEGVETKKQKDFLEQEGCALLQGFLLGRPMPLQKITHLIKEGQIQHYY